MGLRKGFDATVSSETTVFKTIGDIQFAEDKTKIPVVNRASRKKRTRPGMYGLGFTFKVQGGTDPEDTASVDSYQWFLEKYTTEEVFPITFTDAKGNTRTEENVWCSTFNISEPLDDLETADVTVEIAGHDETDVQEISESGWSLAGGSGSGSGS